MDSHKDKFFARNASGVALVEFLLGLAFPVIVESTFLQIFLKKAGASSFLIGMVPAILITGISVFPLLSSYFTRNRSDKKMIVMGLHMLSSLSILGYGVFLFGVTDPGLIVPAFFFSYLLFSLCIGLTFPVWLNFLVKIFSIAKSVKGLSIMMMAQNLGRVISAVFILKAVETWAMSIRSAAIIFTMAGGLFLVGSLCFLITRELPDPGWDRLPDRGSLFAHTRRTMGDIVANPNLVRFLIGDLDNYVTMTVISFYANYATGFFSIPPATAAGLFVGFIYSGAILANFLAGALDVLPLKVKFAATKILCMVMLALLIFMPTLTGFLMASALMGMCRGIRSVIYSPLVKQFAGKEDVTAYFAVIPLMTLAFGAGFPAIFGKVLDRFAHLGHRAYVVMFALSIGIVAITLIFALATRFKNVKKC